MRYFIICNRCWKKRQVIATVWISFKTMDSTALFCNYRKVRNYNCINKSVTQNSNSKIDNPMRGTEIMLLFLVKMFFCSFLCLPTQLPTQGQWWSKRSTQLSHIEQWEALAKIKYSCKPNPSINQSSMLHQKGRYGRYRYGTRICILFKISEQEYRYLSVQGIFLCKNILGVPVPT